MGLDNHRMMTAASLTHALLTDVLAVDVKQACGIIGIVGRRYGRQFVHGLTRAFVGSGLLTPHRQHGVAARPTADLSGGLHRIRGFDTPVPGRE